MKNQKGFSIVEGLLLLAIVCLLVLAGWYVWRQSNKKPLKAINSFETCQAAGNPVRESYPEQCSANGRTFTNSNQTTQESSATITQGVKGNITLRSGDCMPTVGSSKNSCSVEMYNTPSKVIIKKPIDLNNKENKEVVKEIDSVKGTFEVELQPGLYNMYVIHNGKEYCNSFGGQTGEDCEFTVATNKVTDYTLQINTATD